MTKRKQTAVERRTGRELLREHKKLYAKDAKSGECALNRNNACEKCIDCMLYGYAVGGGGAQKSRVMTEDSFSVLKSGTVAAKRTGNALYDNGTMRDPETGTPSQAIFEDPYTECVNRNEARRVRNLGKIWGLQETPPRWVWVD